MILNIFILVICCLVINYFSDKLGDSLSDIGKILKIPNSIRGATLDGISSSLPELLTVLIGVVAVLKGNTEGFNSIGLGTIGGSAMFNLLIIPMLSIFFYKDKINIDINKKYMFRDICFYIVSIIVLLTFSLLGYFNLITGLVLLLVYASYLTVLIMQSKNHNEEIELYEGSSNIYKLIMLSLFCTIPIGLSVHFAVESSMIISSILKVPQIIISLIILASVTSVPDMFLSIKSAKNGELDASISNAVGSNVFDICFCLGIGLLLTGRTILVNFSDVAYIFIFLGISSVVFTYLFMKKITRNKSLILLIPYILFIIYLITKV